MAKSFHSPQKPSHHERGDDHPIVIDDELDRATARIEQLTSEIAALSDHNKTLIAECNDLKRQMVGADVKATQDGLIFKLPFPLQDANHAGHIVPANPSFRLPEGIISAHVRRRMFSISEGLRVSGARLADGTYVTAWQHGLRWLLENIRCGKDDEMPMPKPGARY